MAINYFDIFVIIAMAFFFIKGAYNGFFQEISGIIAIVLSIFLLRMYGSGVADFIGRYSSSSLNYPFAIAIIVVGSFILVSLVTGILNKIMQITFTGWINRILGAIFGLIKGLLLTGIVAVILSWFLKNDPLITSSETIPYLLDVMKQVVDFVLGNYQVLQVEIWK
jgi:membrane protein required for colicin V production